MTLTYSKLKALWPNASEAVLKGVIASLPEAIRIADLKTPRRLKHFFAQWSEESAGGSRLVENLRYTTPARIKQVWPSRFTLASAALYINRPEALANKVYNGRMGNRPNSNDGWTFRGRGLPGITGRDMYELYGLADNPDKASDPNYTLILAAKIWKQKGCNVSADLDDVPGVTRRINGGLTNLAERQSWTRKWSRVFEVVNDAALSIGDESDAVKGLQARLKQLNYAIGRVDGKFGAETQRAVLDFQARNGLPTTGKVDDATSQRVSSPDAEPRRVGEQRAEATVDDLREAGSQTVATADKVKLAGAAVALVGGGNEVGLLEKAKGLLDESSAIKDVLSSAQDVLQWAIGYWPLGLILGGFLLWRYGHLIAKLRLRAHQTGEDMSR